MSLKLFKAFDVMTFAEQQYLRNMNILNEVTENIKSHIFCTKWSTIKDVSFFLTHQLEKFLIRYVNIILTAVMSLR